MMFFDFGCKSLAGFTEVLSPVWGAVSISFLVLGLGLLGRMVCRGKAFTASDVFVGWGAVSAIMTLACVFFPAPLVPLAFVLFFLMGASLAYSIKRGGMRHSLWLVMIFPGVLVLSWINALGLGGFAYDDFSHWAPNALYVFQHDDVPSLAMPATHSLYPGYPYALPFLTYLASMIARGFLVQGGAMINALMFAVFGAMLVERSKQKGLAGWASATLVFSLGLFFISTLSTFGITNQGEAGTMTLCAAISLLLMALLDALQIDDEEEIRRLSLRIGMIAIAFALLKEANLVLLALMVFAFLVLAFRARVLPPAFRALPVLFLPAFAVALIWEFYAKIMIGGGGVGILSPALWRIDMIGGLFLGIWNEVQWKPVFVLLVGATAAGTIVGLFRPRARWSEFMLFALIVQAGYFFFLVIAFLGSDFTEYTIRVAASFHRYMLHAAFLAFPAFWLAAEAALASLKNNHLPEYIGATGVVAALVLFPGIILFEPDWIAMHPDGGTCRVRGLAKTMASLLPTGSQIGVIGPSDAGALAFVTDFELALAEAKVGKTFSLSWRADRFHTFVPASQEEVLGQLAAHPETAAIIYDFKGAEVLGNLGLRAPSTIGVLVRDGAAWKPITN